MLIEFRLRNFRSFREEQALSYVSSVDRSHGATHCLHTSHKGVPRLLKSALIFGANGSGKSNLIAGLRTLRDMVLHSHSSSGDQLYTRYDPFRFGNGAQQPVALGLDVLLEDARYRYDVAYDAERIHRERLLVYRSGKPQRWFERRAEAPRSLEHWLPFSPNFHGPRETWRRATRPNALFLTTAAQLNCAQLRPLFDWFQKDLHFITATDPSHAARLASALTDAPFKREVLRSLRQLDVRASDIRAVERERAFAPAGAASPRGETSSVELLHDDDDGGRAWMRAEAESAGISQALALLGCVLRPAPRRRLLVVDEFATNLHPLTSRLLVKIFHELPAAAQDQTLLVTHNIALMDPDVLRRDEIWLMDLDSHHASTLATMLRWSPRKGALLAKRYLSGCYGGVPRAQGG